MEKSEVQKEIFDLGKLLVKQLGLDKERDTIAKWMAHYIAEKMDFAENCPDAEKKQAQRECSDAILALWQHRWSFPKGKRPLERFDELFDTIALLRKKRTHPLYFNDLLDLSEMEGSEWLEAVHDIDKGARTAILLALHEATVEARDESVDQLLTTAGVLEQDNDIAIIEELSSNVHLPDDQEQFLAEDYSQGFELRYLKGQLDEVQLAKKHLEDIESLLSERYAKLSNKK